MIEVFDMITGRKQRVSMTLTASPADLDNLLARPPSADSIKQLNEIFIRKAHDKKLYHTYVPKLSGFFLVAYLQHNPAGFWAVLQRYDNHVRAKMSFKYCDTVARLYREIFNLSYDTAIRRLVLERLLIMGDEHNRWFVLGVFCDLIGNIQDANSALIAVEVLKAHPDVSQRLSELLLERKPLALIKKTIVELTA